MNVFYEEDGGFKVARVMEDIGTSLQIESISGKRSKIKANAVLLRFESSLPALLPSADALANDIDCDFLYEVCGADEFGFAELAIEYFGHPPAPPEAAAVAIKLHGAPMYFYKRGKGRFQKAPPENLKAALASIERKAREAAQMAGWVEALKSGVLPEEIRPHLNMALYKPDRNTLIVKACEKAVEQSGLTLPKLFYNANAWPDRANAVHAYHLGKFLADYFPKGVDEQVALAPPPLDLKALPLTTALAYSIDDATTTEIDDAFSLQRLADGALEVGIHIAAPALFFALDSALDVHAAKRASTVYYPGAKITMLPAEAVAAATLTEGRDCPVVSLYATFSDAVDSTAPVSTRSCIERVRIERNLRLHELEQRLTVEAIATGAVAGEWGTELLTLHRIALGLRTVRGAKDEPDRLDFNVDLIDGRIDISTRQRGNPIDTVVAEMMIFANSQWGKLLADNGVAAIYRVQQNQKTRMTVDALPHEGLGVACYAWCSSPLRRYVDLVNQRQLIALLQGIAPPFEKRRRDAMSQLNAIAREFDVTYDAYNEFQRGMERYWSLRYLEQEGLTQFAGTIIRDELVRAAALPMIVRLSRAPGLPGKTSVVVQVDAIDYWMIGGEFSLVVKAA